jgi:D-alanine-D-alanine ligase
LEKLKIAVIFGGKSTEHNVSVVSGTSVVKNMNKDKYEIFPVYIDNDGKCYSYEKDINDIEILELGEEIDKKVQISNVMEFLDNVDVIFPVLHGLYGEDGTIQGLFEILNKPYVGCGVFASAVCMDKAYTKVVLEKAKIPQVKHMYIKKNNGIYTYVDDEFNFIDYDLDNLSKLVVEKLGETVFIKPSNSGSSVGVHKADNIDNIKKYIVEASKYDNKIIIEESIDAREIECAVIGNSDVRPSILGEILPAEEFYSFDAKYNNSESRTKAPADLSDEETELIKSLAVKAFKAVDGKGLSRVDFFKDRKTGKIYLNEINTLPGFTKISMYPQLFEKCGLSYSDLIDKLIELALKII